MHFVTARAFRHRDDGGPAVFSDFKKVIYVDRLKPESDVASFDAITQGVNENRRVTARSLDLTADNIHVFLDLGAALTDEQVKNMVSGASQANRIDRDLWTKDFFGLGHGNHVLTVVTFEMTGTWNVQRFAGQFTSTIFGAGLGDTTFNGLYDVADVDAFAHVFFSDNALFNAAADFDGNGLIDRIDLDLFGDKLVTVGADAATLAAYQSLLNTVPEPATLTILTLITLTTLHRRRSNN